MAKPSPLHEKEKLKVDYMFEHFFHCPYCWEPISMLLDSSVTEQTYVEDCEVCCNPIELSVSFMDGGLESFDAREIGQ